MTATIQSTSISGEAGSVVRVPVWRGDRAQGAVVAAGIALAATILGIAIGQVWGMAIGIPAATISGWALAPRVRTDRSPLGAVVSMAALTIALADAMVVIGIGVATIIAGSVPFGEVGLLELIARAVFFGAMSWLFGMIFVGIVSLLVTIPCAALWALGVRHLARHMAIASCG